MTPSLPRVAASVVISKPSLQKVFDNLKVAGFSLVGPTVREGAIVLDEISEIENLPVGWSDQQAPGRYRIKHTREAQYFGYSCGPQSWKNYLHPPRLKLFSVEKDNGNWRVQPAQNLVPRYAFIGVRSCELSAIGLQDRVFMGGEYRDPHYAHRRGPIFILAVHCTQPASTCFCVSMKTGPRATGGFDLALVELPDTLVVEVGSEAGSEMLRDTAWQPATAFDQGRVTQACQRAEREMQRQMRTDDLPRVLYDNLEHPRWDQIATRCLSCANCTQVCPTCFCVTVEDHSDLKGKAAERTRVWDSCYSLDYSHVHGGNIRPTIKARYRQWMTHKLASWIDQFGVIGCVGCGRCMTWCPVGIDITEELQAIRQKA
jgi:ferredoxin